MWIFLIYNFKVFRVVFLHLLLEPYETFLVEFFNDRIPYGFVNFGNIIEAFKYCFNVEPRTSAQDYLIISFEKFSDNGSASSP